MKIISGGQSGVDRAALDAALELGIPHGGWCPKGRTAEDGVIHEKYKLSETESSNYAERTQLNVQDSDATLICLWKNAAGLGTNLTKNQCEKHKKPCLCLHLDDENAGLKFVRWYNRNKIEVLNVAGNRESQTIGIYSISRAFFVEYFLKLGQ